MNEINIRGRRADTAAVAGLTLSDPLQYGVYNVWADGVIAIGVGTPEATAAADAANGLGGPLDLRTLTVLNGHPVATDETLAVRIAQNGDVIGFIGAATNVYWHKVD